MNTPRIIFMGTPPFAVATLNALIEAGRDVAAVVTAPDRPAGRGRQVHMSAVKERALELGLPILQPEKLKDPDFHRELDAINASLYVVVAFRMLPEQVWARPVLGTINLHASLLPDYRGAAPINWALINGEQRSGVTTFFIRQEIDTGDVLMQEEVPIGPEETAGELHDRLMAIGATLVVHTVHALSNGSIERVPQKQGSAQPPHHAPKLTPENCRIDWHRNAQQVHDHIRGLSPKPGAWTTMTQGPGAAQHFKILRSRVAQEDPAARAGTAHMKDGRLFIRCATGTIEALEVQAEGKRRMSSTEFTNGLHDTSSILFV